MLGSGRGAGGGAGHWSRGPLWVGPGLPRLDPAASSTRPFAGTHQASRAPMPRVRSGPPGPRPQVRPYSFNALGSAPIFRALDSHADSDLRGVGLGQGRGGLKALGPGGARGRAGGVGPSASVAGAPKASVLSSGLDVGLGCGAGSAPAGSAPAPSPGREPPPRRGPEWRRPKSRQDRAGATGAGRGGGSRGGSRGPSPGGTRDVPAPRRIERATPPIHDGPQPRRARQPGSHGPATEGPVGRDARREPEPRAGPGEVGARDGAAGPLRGGDALDGHPRGEGLGDARCKPDRVYRKHGPSLLPHFPDSPPPMFG